MRIPNNNHSKYRKIKIITSAALILFLSFLLTQADQISQLLAERIGVSPSEHAWPVQTFPEWPVDSAIYKSQNIMVYDETAKRVMLNKNGDVAVPIASLVKIMTVVLALEKLDDYTTKTAVVTSETISEMQAQNAATAGFGAGEKVTYRDLLYGTMLPSGGEATVTLAKTVAGTEADFVDLMNQKARQLDLRSAVFKNSTGLDATGQVASARDVVKLLRHALKNPDFRQIFTTSRYQAVNGKTLKNTVLSQIKPEDQTEFEVLGGKSGTTYAAGLCWASLAKKADHELLIVTLGAPLDNLNRPTLYQKMDLMDLLQTAPLPVTLK